MILRVAASISALAVALFVAPSYAADLAKCAAIADDRQRLACFDKLTAAAGSARPKKEENREAVLNVVIRRCRTEMSSYGSTIVKACVDQDMAAYVALRDYPPPHAPFIDRCKRDMSAYGWSIIKACADQDIAAERALRGMKN